MSLSSCKKDYQVQLNSSFWWEWSNDMPENQHIYYEIIISGDNGTHQNVGGTVDNNNTSWGIEDFTNYFELEKGNYTVKFRCWSNVWDSDGYHPFENTQTKYITVDYTGTYYLYFDDVKFYYTKPSGGGGGGGGGGGSTTVTDNQGHVLTGWELQSNGNYHKKFTANYVVSGNWQAYPSNTNWTYTVTVAYRPASGTYMLYEPFFNPSSNQGLGLGYSGVTWGYNSVKVHTYTHYDYDTHVMYEADCYCRFTVQ